MSMLMQDFPKYTYKIKYVYMLNSRPSCCKALIFDLSKNCLCYATEYQNNY